MCPVRPAPSFRWTRCPSTRAVRKAFAASSDVWPPPRDLGENGPEVWRAYGVKPYRDFDPVAMVTIDRRKSTGVVRLCEMTRNSRGGHSPVENRYIRVPTTASVQTLARKIANAVARFEAAYRPRRH